MEQPTMSPHPTLQASIVADEEGNERVQYLIDGEEATEAAYDAARTAMYADAQRQAQAVSAFLDAENATAAEAAAVAETEAEGRRARAAEELSALGLSPETIEAIVRSA